MICVCIYTYRYICVLQLYTQISKYLFRVRLVNIQNKYNIFLNVVNRKFGNIKYRKIEYK